MIGNELKNIKTIIIVICKILKPIHTASHSYTVDTNKSARLALPVLAV